MSTKFNAISNQFDLVNAVESFVVGPAVSTDNAIARFDSTTGKLVQNSGVIISDTDQMSGVAQLTLDLGASITEFSIDGTLAGNSDTALPTEKAVKTYVDTSGSSGITWNNITGTSQAMSISNGYFTNNAGLVTLTLPVTAARGSVIKIAGVGAGGWLIAQNAGQTLKMSTALTTTGVGGSLASTEQTDSLELVCYVADTSWMITSSIGNITVV